ncbi:MAG: glutamate racemase [Lachnospiraceae bacterium]|nr:glutamate racemase [Lachnospiraceae bacterium]
MKIGIFDSGIGGLSVLYEAREKLPEADFIFYGDFDHVPYGEKSESEIISYADDAVRFLSENGCDAIVIACNTATSAAASHLRSCYELPIIGMEPAAKKALELDPEKRVIVAATPFTVSGPKMQELMERFDTEHHVDLLAMPLLVTFAERGEFVSEAVQEYIRNELSRYELSAYSAFVLGCTHFNYFKDTFREVLPEHIALVDGNEGTVNQLLRKVGAFPTEGCESRKINCEYADICHGCSVKEGTVRYYISGRKASEADTERFELLQERLGSMKAIV